jgi:transcription-repair coupling factor (superfamily II helicase)
MERLGVLKNADTPSLVFMSVRALMTRVLPARVLREGSVRLEAGQTYDHAVLERTLVASGYEHAGTVYSKGEFARRGEILDIYASDSVQPIRITFFDDEIESIRFFDPETQKSLGKKLKHYILPPAREVVLDEGAKNKIREYLVSQPAKYEKIKDEILFEVEEYGSFEIADTFLPILYETESVLDHFGDALGLFDDFERVNPEANRIKTEFADIHARLMKTYELLPYRGSLFETQVALKNRRPDNRYVRNPGAP